MHAQADSPLLINVARKALSRLGCTAKIQADPVNAGLTPHGDNVLNIVLGPDFLNYLPDEYILYQTENLDSWVQKSPGYVEEAEHHAVAVWEFSPEQVYYWQARSVPVAWIPVYVLPSNNDSFQLSSGERRETIHVLFYGGMSERRQTIAARLERWAKKAGRQVVISLGHELTGQNREAIVQQSQLLLNMHSVASRVLEVHRINWGLSRNKCIISEWSSDVELDAKYAEAIVFTDLTDLEETLERYLLDDEARHACETRGQRFIHNLLSEPRPLTQALSVAHGTWSEDWQ